jgi:hypothetical protein
VHRLQLAAGAPGCREDFSATGQGPLSGPCGLGSETSGSIRKQLRNN